MSLGIAHCSERHVVLKIELPSKAESNVAKSNANVKI